MSCARVWGGCAALGVLLMGCAATGSREPTLSILDPHALAGVTAAVSVPTIKDAWWTDFQDLQLSELINDAFAHSPSVAVATARLSSANALLVVARAQRLPQTQVTASVERELLTAKLYPPPFGGATVNLGQLNLDLGYEIDLVGRSRARIEVGNAGSRGAEADLAATRLSLAAAITRAYVQLARTDALAAIAGDLLQERQKWLALTKVRQGAGVDTEFPVESAAAGVATAEAELAVLANQRSLLLNALAELVGMGPGRVPDSLRPALSLVVMPSVPDALPADLVSRRPDVLSSQQRVLAAAGEVKLAEDAFYPNINLSAFAGFESLELSSLISTSARNWGVGPAISLPLFDVGRLRGQLGVKDAAYRAAVAQYNGSVLSAFREVADALTSLHHLVMEKASNRDVLVAVEHAYNMTQARFTAGLVDQMSVLAAQERLLEQQRVVAEIDSRHAELVIALIRALGGGFSTLTLPVSESDHG